MNIPIDAAECNNNPHNLTFQEATLNIVKFYIHFTQNEQSFMTFEGQQLQGAVKIMEKLQVNCGVF